MSQPIQRILPSAANLQFAATEANVTMQGIFMDSSGQAITTFDYNMPFSGNLATDTVSFDTIYQAAIASLALPNALYDESRGRSRYICASFMYDQLAPFVTKVRFNTGRARQVPVDDRCPLLSTYAVVGNYGS
jgi:hypothetical protein